MGGRYTHHGHSLRAPGYRFQGNLSGRTDDSALFEIGATSEQATSGRGRVSWKSAPDFESPPTGADALGVYDLRVYNTHALHNVGGESGAAGCTGSALDLTVRLQDVGAPAKVQGVAATASDDTTIALSWAEPETDSAGVSFADLGAAVQVTRYDYRHRAVGTATWTDGNTTNRSVEITVTETGRYQVQVRAVSGEGDGAWSDVVTVEVADVNNAREFPSASPSFSIAENTAANTNVGTPVTATDADSDTLEYSLSRDDSFTIDSGTGQIKTRAGVSYDYEAQDAYMVEVQADDGNGGTDSIEVRIEITNVDEPPLEPDAPAVVADSSNTTTLVVSWTAPDNAGRPDIESYDLRYREGTSGSWTDGPQDQTGTNAEITGLDEDTAHQVQVRATNEEGDGPWSDSGSGTTGAPAPAPTITALAVTSTPQLESDTYGAGEIIEFTVTFSAAVRVTGDPQFGFSLAGPRVADYDSGSDTAELVFVYTVVSSDTDTDGIWIGNHNSSTRTLQLDADDAIRSLGGTDANLEHDVVGRQPDHKVDGSRSPQGTVPDAPARPEVTVPEGSFTSLDVSWTEPALNGAEAITGYDVQYQESGGTWTDWPHEGTGTTTTITGLEAGTGYRARVQALNPAGASGWSLPSNEVSTGSYPIRGICSRTPRVRDRILTLLKNRHSFKGACAEVTETELAKLTSLDLRRNPSNESAFSIRLRADDFKGLWNLVELDLADTGLRSLPAGVFDGLTDLETLNLNKNRLASLPAGVFAGLRSLETLRLNNNSSLRSIPYDELEGLPKLKLLRVDRAGRRKLQVAGGERDATLQVRAGSSGTYQLRLMSGPNSRVTASNPVVIEATSDTTGVTASGSIRFTGENWFRRQTMTVRATTRASGKTARLDHEASGTTTDSGGNAQSNYDFESYPLPGVTVQVLEPTSSPGGAAEPLTAEFEDLPEDGHDGETPFSFRIAFSEDIATSAADMRDHALTVTGGTVTDAGRVDGRSDLWRFTVRPAGDDMVAITLPGDRECSDAGAICTEDGRKLSAGIAVTVLKRPDDPEQAPLTAELDNVPEEHDGDNAFRFRVAFSEDVDGLGANSFTVADGEVTGTARVNGRYDLWEVTVEPDSDDAVTVTLRGNRTCGTSGAVCTRGDDPQPLTNSPSATVAGAPDNRSTNTPATGRPTISGTPQVGETLRASTSDIADADGMKNARFAYQWIRGSGDIGGATGSSYTVVDADEGERLKVRVSFTDDAGNAESVTSRATDAVAELPDNRATNTPATGGPTISGTPQVGETLTASTSDISDADGMKNARFAYQWIRENSDIGGATGSSYTAVEADEGERLKVRVSFTDDAGNEESLTSAATNAVAPVPNTPATGAPTISGTPQVDETLSASTSGISDADGLDEARFAHQWVRGDSDIDGATGSSYTAVEADEGERLKVRVSFTDDAGNAESLTSAATDAVAPKPEPLTASLENLPSEHRGEGDFPFRVQFSDEIKISYKTMRDTSFRVTNADITGARRVDGRRDLWEMTVEPDSHQTVTIRLPKTTGCDATGAVCTSDGRPLSHALSATVRGPVGISVADARVDENKGAALAFAVTLTRAASETLTVDYATENGSATAGDDYTAASGTLTFRSGESSKTIEVAVLDDSHDEGEETLTLRLSNASGGRVADGEATGTIVNRDPLPRALLARFGRAAAVHVVEHVEERMEAPREPGFRGEVAGRELRRGMERDVALQFLNQLGGRAGVHTPMAEPGVAGATRFGTPGVGTSVGMPGAAGAIGGGHGMTSAAPGMMGAATAPMGAPAGTMSGAPGPGGGLLDGGLYAMGLGGDSLLTGSSFALNRETSRGGILSFWSRGARSSFQGREGALSLGGDVRTTMFGADYAKGPLVVGLSLARSQGLGNYAGKDSGQVASAVTGLYPWLAYKLNERVSVWGVTGYGAGGLLLTPQGGPALESGLSMKMSAAGTRGELVPGGQDGFGLAFKADALWVGTATDGVDGPAGRMAATEAAVSRVRTALEGSRGFTFGRGLSLKPSIEVGVRHDAGDAEQGSGMDVGGGLVVSDPVTGLAVDVRVRMLLVHEAEDFRERGVSVSLSYNPTPQTPLGFTARVAPSWGGQATSGAQALWGRDTMAGVAHGGLASGNRLDGEVGYGLPVGSRFVGTPRVGFTTSEYGRDYRVGYTLGALENDKLTFQLGVDAQRRESPMLGGTSNGLLGRASVGW